MFHLDCSGERAVEGDGRLVVDLGDALGTRRVGAGVGFGRDDHRERVTLVVRLGERGRVAGVVAPDRPGDGDGAGPVVERNRGVVGLGATAAPGHRERAVGHTGRVGGFGVAVGAADRIDVVAGIGGGARVGRGFVVCRHRGICRFVGIGRVVGVSRLVAGGPVGETASGQGERARGGEATEEGASLHRSIEDGTDKGPCAVSSDRLSVGGRIVTPLAGSALGRGESG